MPKKNKREKILAEKAAARKENGNTSAKKKAKKENAKKKKDSPERNARKKEFDDDKSQILEISKQLINLGVDVRNISQKDRFEPEIEKLLNKYFSLRKAKSRRSIDKKKSKRNSKK